jgi:beta-glucosidase
MKVQAEGFSGGDRTKIDLPAPQEQLLEKIQATGKPLVLVLMNGSALAVNWAEEHVPAIVEAWYPGEEGGTAVAGLLAGDFNPGGRLPVTFYKSVEQLPAFDDYSMSKRTYRYFDGQPLYPFGYGLSFTKFEYANAHAEKGGSNSVTLSVDVKNSGSKAGDEVVQVYLTHLGVPGAPLRVLKGFKRIHLEAGQKQTVQFTLVDRDLSTVDEAGKRLVVPGKVQVWIGGGQPIGRNKAAGIATEFNLDTAATLPD